MNKQAAIRHMTGTIYALVNQSGKIRATGTTLDSVTRTLIHNEMSKAMWNEIFRNGNPDVREKIYKAHGWAVARIDFNNIDDTK